MDGSQAPIPGALTREQFDALQRELDEIRDEVMASRGERDAKHIRFIVRLARWCAITGRSLLHFGIIPGSWLLGTIALSLAKILENMEVGHNVIHGQYDFLNDPTLNSQTYEWDIVCASSNWRNYHNYLHHTHTNILGKDHDLGYGVVRVTEKQRWVPYNLLQPIWYGFLAHLFQWGVAIHDIKIDYYFKGKISWQNLKVRLQPFLKKTKHQMFKDYVLFPALALWNWPRVMLGNMTANLVRNLWTNVIIFCGHFPKGVRVYTLKETQNESRGQWYVRQMQGSANISGPNWFYVMTGHLSHQIEHHLFPDMPSHRYPEIAARVRAICEKYGVSYTTGNFFQQYGSVLSQMVRFSLPPPKKPTVAAA